LRRHRTDARAGERQGEREAGDRREGGGGRRGSPWDKPWQRAFSERSSFPISLLHRGVPRVSRMGRAVPAVGPVWEKWPFSLLYAYS